jgi:formylmethanofuran--tetrahydromethanopterin N-formyltransferase
MFAIGTENLNRRLVERIGQTVLTCPTTSCFDGLPEAPDRVPVGRALRAFGDKFQISKVVGGQRYWRVPVMEGEFLLQESFGVQKRAVGGGNFLILGEDAPSALAAAEAAVAAMDGMPGIILPFPGGVGRSGSKVGSRGYKSMIASTNDAYCPTLRLTTDSALAEGVNSVLEIVIDGLDARYARDAPGTAGLLSCVRASRRGLRGEPRHVSFPPATDHGGRVVSTL